MVEKVLVWGGGNSLPGENAVCLFVVEGGMKNASRPGSREGVV